jgi:DUF1365 family protein
MYSELESKRGDFMDQYWFWATSEKKPLAIGRLRRSDYLSKTEVKKMVKDELGTENVERVFLLTHWRYWGFSFNPISYYHCFDCEGNLSATISEVHNTPWGEKCYYVQHPTPSTRKNFFEDRKKKKMHVSPFFTLDFTYKATWTKPSIKFFTNWKLEKEDGSKHFDATMALEAVPITQRNLNYLLFFFPFMTIKVVAAIYWEAFLLYFKVPFVPHPKYSQLPLSQ